MLSYRLISFLIAVVLPIGSQVVIASDDNPWSMEVPGEGQQPYYDLNGMGSGGFVGDNQAIGNKNAPRAPTRNDGANESTIRKTIPGGEHMGWQSAPGKGNRDEVFGYAGPQSGSRVGPRITEQMPATRDGGSVRFGGKVFGAFPPRGARSEKIQSQNAPNIQGRVRGDQGQQGGAFANVPPPPIPDAAPRTRILPYPYLGYGAAPGYGTPYGTRNAPDAGAGLPGSGGLNYGSRGGPTLSNPGMPPGVFGPGFMW